MKKLLLTLALALCFIMGQAQSVLGIKFGSSYDEVKEQLENRFGYYSTHPSGGNIVMSNISMGGVEFNLAEFGFQYKGNYSWFNSATFQKYFAVSETKDAKEVRDYLYSLIREKYEDEYLETFTNEEGFKCYKFGLNPYDDSKVLGIISLTKSKGKDGKQRLYLLLEYLPIWYLSKSSDF